MSIFKELKKINENLDIINRKLGILDLRTGEIEKKLAKNFSESETGNGNPAKGQFKCPKCPATRKPFLWKQAWIRRLNKLLPT